MCCKARDGCRLSKPGAPHKGDLWTSRAKGLRGAQQSVLGSQTHLQDNNEHYLLLSASNWISTTLRMNVDQEQSLLPRRSACQLEGAGAASEGATRLYECFPVSGQTLVGPDEGIMDGN